MWKPGQSGNPGGRPKKLPDDVREVLRSKLPAATAKLCQLVNSKNPSIALAAVKEIYDRCLGRAPQAVTVGGDPLGEPIRLEDVSERDMARRIALLLGQAARAAGEDEEGTVH